MRLTEWIEGHPFLAVGIERLNEVETPSTQAGALEMQLPELGMEIVSLMPGVPAELAPLLQGMRSPSQLPIWRPAC